MKDVEGKLSAIQTAGDVLKSQNPGRKTTPWAASFGQTASIVVSCRAVRAIHFSWTRTAAWSLGCVWSYSWDRSL